MRMLMIGVCDTLNRFIRDISSQEKQLTPVYVESFPLCDLYI